MISGLSSSGIATAIRTAGRARETMDTMSRQIATGQRVSSVKDDSAAWSRAAGLKSQIAGTQALRTNLERLQMVFTVNAAATEARMEQIEPLEQNALAAMDPGLSASARAALQAAQSIAPSPTAAIGAASHDQFSSSGARFTYNNLDADNQLAVLVTETGATQTFQGSGLATAPVGSTTDLSTPATAAAARQLILDSLAHQRSRLAYWGSVSNGLGQLESHLSRAEDRLQAGIGSLTDADLGKASAARAQAETRQQLALSTVRQAISAYSSFATVLLGNVQRTQRAIG
jgi:flagellin